MPPNLALITTIITIAIQDQALGIKDICIAFIDDGWYMDTKFAVWHWKWVTVPHG